MRIDLLPHKIKVTVIHPGAAETEFSLVRLKQDANEAKKVYAGYQPLRAEDIAEYSITMPLRYLRMYIQNELEVTCLARRMRYYLFKDPC